MSKIIEFELVHDPSKEQSDEKYHTILIAQGTTLHLISIPIEMADYMPPWSIWKIKNERKEAAQNCEKLGEEEILSFSHLPNLHNQKG